MIEKARDEEEQLRRLKKERGSLWASAFAGDKNNECVVCLEKLAEHVILDCMHVCLCDGTFQCRITSSLSLS